MGSRKAVFLLQTDPFLPKPVLRALREAESLTRAGWDRAFVSWIKDEQPAQEGKDSYTTHRVKVPVPPIGTSFVRRGLAYRDASRKLRDAAQKETPDLLVAHDFEVLSAAVAAGRRGRRVPVIYDSHEDWPALIAENSALEARIAKVQERRLCRRVAHVITVSEPIADKFRRMNKDTTVLYNARPESEIRLADRAASRRSFGYAIDDFVVGFAGALAGGRGLDILLGALPTLPASAKALIVGGPDEEAERLRALARAEGLQDRVRVDGYRAFRELAPYYASMDVGVILLDRRPNHERALPNKLFDYMAHGVAVIVPEYPAIAPIVMEGPCGWTVPDIRLEAVSAILREVQSSGEARARGKTGREAYVRRYAWDRQEERFLQIVRAVTEGHVV